MYATTIKDKFIHFVSGYTNNQMMPFVTRTNLKIFSSKNLTTGVSGKQRNKKNYSALCRSKLVLLKSIFGYLMVLPGILSIAT